MRDIAFNYESDRYPFLAVHLALKNYYNHFQRFAIPSDSYLESFTNLEDVIKHCGGASGHQHPSLKKYIFDKKKISENTTDADEIKKVKNATDEAYSAIAFLCGLNQARYQGLLDELANSYLNGQDEYPKTIVAAYNLALHWSRGNETAHVGNNDGVTFSTTDDDNDEAAQVNATSDGMVRRSDGILVKCKICGGNHWPNKCPNKPSKGKKGNSDDNPSSPNAAPEVEQPSGNDNITNTTVEAEVVASPVEEVSNLTLQGS